MYRFLLVSSAIVFVVFIPKEEAATKCRSRLNCTQPNASFCCKENSAWYSPFVCLRTCANRTCEDDNECVGTGGECCNTVDKTFYNLCHMTGLTHRAIVAPLRVTC